MKIQCETSLLPQSQSLQESERYHPSHSCRHYTCLQCQFQISMRCSRGTFLQINAFPEPLVYQGWGYLETLLSAVHQSNDELNALFLVHHTFSAKPGRSPISENHSASIFQLLMCYMADKCSFAKSEKTVPKSRKDSNYDAFELNGKAMWADPTIWRLLVFFQALTSSQDVLTNSFRSAIKIITDYGNDNDRLSLMAVLASSRDLMSVQWYKVYWNKASHQHRKETDTTESTKTKRSNPTRCPADTEIAWRSYRNWMHINN